MKAVLALVLTISLIVGFKIPNAAGAVTESSAPTISDPTTAKTNHVTTDASVMGIINNPAFGGFGRFLFPVERGLPNSGLKLANIGSLLPYHNNIDQDTTARVINYMLDEVGADHTIFYDIYSDAEKRAAPSKENTGLFFFRSQAGAPLAIISADGGFSYVGSIHESFPLALELSHKGYNAFAIQYRTGGADAACQDLAAAISFIFDHAEELRVDTQGYSLWGGSAGARMAAYLGSYGAVAYGGDDLPRPAAVIMQYTGHTDYTKNDPPTYVCIGANEGIASPQTMQRRINNLKALGIDTEFHVYPNLGHGFGLGLGTSAEGWWKDALMFWEKQLPSPNPVAVPTDLAPIPPQYYAPTQRQGTLIKLYYDTYESKTYEQKTHQLTKRAIVYFPYGYSDEKQYNAFTSCTEAGATKPERSEGRTDHRRSRMQ
jgi:acetyl esterase/lipase